MTLKDSLLWPLTLPYGAISHLRARAYRTRILKQKDLAGLINIELPAPAEQGS